ncbi:hypothetical protein BJX76DRAFT_337447 [Aspergillus varians]
MGYYLECIKLLLKHGANPCAETPDGEFPLSLPSRYQDSPAYEVVSALVKAFDRRVIPFSVVGPQLRRALAIFRVERPDDRRLRYFCGNTTGRGGTMRATLSY